ncbi:hypothetical protein QJS04_geneDACA014387 [Acorus gramineus]|uniref:Uncharacterized protein n=1 Tax=Acorus gramineus TaxID=55184 RepID=A0AAV8ZYI9_ACOGR|nr:hypothetical protein QJS04_geneDACA014387 [Acorus gramineus]
MDDPITEHEHMFSQPIICPNDRQTIDLEHKNFERTEAFRGQLPVNSTNDHSCYFSSIRDIDLFSPCQSRISQAPPEPSSLPFNSYQDSGLITYRERPFTACNPSNADQHLIRERNLERMGPTTFTDMFHHSASLSAYLQEKYDPAPSHEAYGPAAVPNVHFYGRAESYEPLVPSSSYFQERRELVTFPEKYNPSDAKIQYSIERSQSYEPSVPRSSYFLEGDGPTAFPETYGPSASTKPYTHERDPSVARIPSPHIAGNIMDLSCPTSGGYRLLPRDHAHPEASKYKEGNDRPQDNGYEAIHGYFPSLDKTENLNPSGLPCNYWESSHPSRSPDYYQEDEYDEDAEYDAKMKSYAKKTSVFARLSKAPEPVMHVSTVNNVERDPSVGKIMERFSKGRGTSPMSKWWNDDNKKLQTSQWENANYVERDPLVGETMGHFSKGRGTPIISKRWMEDDKNLQTTQWEGSESDVAIDAQGGSFGTDREVENESRIPFLDFKRRSKVRKEDTEGEQQNSVEGLPEKSKRRKLIRPSFDKVEHSNSNIFGLGYSGGWVPSMSCIEKGTSIISEASSSNRCHVKVNTEVFDKMEDKMEGMTDNVRGDHVLEEESREHSVCQVPSHGKCYEEVAQDSDFCEAPSGSKCNDRKTSRVSMCQTDAAYMNAEGWDSVNKPVMGLNIDHIQKEVTKDLGTCYGNSNEGVSRANVSEAQSVAISNIKESLGLDVCQSDTSAMNVEVKSSADVSAVGLYVDGMDKLQELDIHQSSLGNANGSLGSENLDLSRMAIEKFGVEQPVISERNHQISDKAGNDSSKIGMEKFLAEDENCQVENSIEDAENKEKKNELSEQKTNSIQFGEEIMNETPLQNPSNVSVKNA